MVTSVILPFDMVTCTCTVPKPDSTLSPSLVPLLPLLEEPELEEPEFDEPPVELLALALGAGAEELDDELPEFEDDDEPELELLDELEPVELEADAEAAGALVTPVPEFVVSLPAELVAGAPVVGAPNDAELVAAADCPTYHEMPSTPSDRMLTADLVDFLTRQTPLRGLSVPRSSARAMSW